jgi:hypothetical protein
VNDAATLADPGWRSLPRTRLASSLEVIARSDERPWRTVWRIPLGRPAASTRR